MNKQVLDKLKVERERGITGMCNENHNGRDMNRYLSEGANGQVCAPFSVRSALTESDSIFSMFHSFGDKKYLLNLIDTPVSELVGVCPQANTKS